jgi:putative MATE family efflux protein
MNFVELTEMRLKKLLIKFLFPSILAMLATSLNILCDTIFISLGVGKEGLSALGIAIPIYNIYNAVSLLIGMGGATLYSINMGKKKKDKANQVFSTSIFIAIIIGLSISIFGYIFSRNIAIMFGASEEILGLSNEYLKIILLSGINFILSGVLQAFIRNDGAPKLSMIAGITGNMFNVIFDYIFIFVFDMGMRGAAIATAIAPIVTLIIISIKFIKKSGHLRFKYKSIKIPYITNIFKLGISSSFIEVSGAIVIILFNYILIDMIGEIGVAAYSIISNIALIGVAILSGISQSIQPIVSVNFGAENYDRVIKTRKAAIYLALAFGVTFFLVGNIFTKEIISFFNNSDQNLIEITTRGMKIYFSAFIFIGINMVNISFFQAINHAKISNTMSIIKSFILVLVNLYILPRLFGVDGLWVTIPVAEVITLFIGVFIVKRNMDNILKYMS